MAKYITLYAMWVLSLKLHIQVVGLFAPDWKQITKMPMNIPYHTENYNFIATRE